MSCCCRYGKKSGHNDDHWGSWMDPTIFQFNGQRLWSFYKGRMRWIPVESAWILWSNFALSYVFFLCVCVNFLLVYSCACGWKISIEFIVWKFLIRWIRPIYHISNPFVKDPFMRDNKQRRVSFTLIHTAKILMSRQRNLWDERKIDPIEKSERTVTLCNTEWNHRSNIWSHF